MGWVGGGTSSVEALCTTYCVLTWWTSPRREQFLRPQSEPGPRRRAGGQVGGQMGGRLVGRVDCGREVALCGSRDAEREKEVHSYPTSPMHADLVLAARRTAAGGAHHILPRHGHYLNILPSAHAPHRAVPQLAERTITDDLEFMIDHTVDARRADYAGRAGRKTSFFGFFGCC